MPLYLFFDESGNLDFSPNGTRYYSFGVLSTRNPAPLNQALTTLRYALMEESIELEYLHASEDKQAVRNRVFDAIAAAGDVEFDVLVVEKHKTNPLLRDPLRFYPELGSHILGRVFERHTEPGERVIVITDRLPLARQRKATEKAFKTYIRQHLGERSFAVLHHASSAHPGLQAADYCTWAVHRKWNNGDLRSYQRMQHLIRSEVDLFEENDEVYY